MQYRVTLTKNFDAEKANCPKKVQKAFRDHLEILQSSPTEGSNIKKLKGFKNIWRIRLSDSYRLVYTVDVTNSEISLIKIGDRKNVYEAISYKPGDGPTLEIIANSPTIIEDDLRRKKGAEAIFVEPEEIAHSPERSLPFELTKEWLERINIPEKLISSLVGCKTEEELLRKEVTLGGNVLERVLVALYPQKVQEILGFPVKDLPPEDFDALAEGVISLDQLLLRLDPEQKEFVQRFSNKQSGPWLLKGGPGSGKSTVALYCINEILFPKQTSLIIEQKQKILFCTYTNALTRASEQLIRSLSRQKAAAELTISTFDKYIWRFRSSDGLCFLDEKEIARRIGTILFGKKYSFPAADASYLAEEFEWVIYGNGICSVEEYLSFDRIGRGKALNKQQRREVWGIFTEFESGLGRQETTFKKQINDAFIAASSLQNKFDHVFIDEAQDLTPQAIRLCIALCKTPKNIFITADANQSIYGVGFSWNRIDDSLNVKGKTKILKKNYRTTKEIMLGALDMTETLNRKDTETLKDQFVKRGDTPIYYKATNVSDETNKICQFIHESAMKLRLSYGNVGVLCSSNRIGQEFEAALNKFNAKFFKGKELDLSHSGVKVMTMHSAKGLQFPIVVVPRITGDFLLQFENESDVLDRKKKLLFVAFSRAMNRLLVTTIKDKECSLLGLVSDEHWEIQSSDLQQQNKLNNQYDVPF